MPIVKCSYCQKEIYRTPDRLKYYKKFFCSYNCHFAYKKGKHHSISTEFKKGHKPYPVYGEKNHFWKGGICFENYKLRRSAKFAKWRKKVFERDNYTCWICEERGAMLHPHHLKKFSDYPELRFEVSNGLTLCEFCHKTYTEFGNQWNKKQLISVNQIKIW